MTWGCGSLNVPASAGIGSAVHLGESFISDRGPEGPGGPSSLNFPQGSILSKVRETLPGSLKQ